MASREAVLFVGGVDDPEMRTIERLVTYAGCRFVDALAPDGSVLQPENAYRAILPETTGIDEKTEVVTVEAGLATEYKMHTIVAHIDHHNQGDFGYDKSPRDAWIGSSIGQTTGLLTQWGLLPSLSVAEKRELRTYGAMDHCLAAAVQGKTPGVKPADVVALSTFETARSHMISMMGVERCMTYMAKELERSKLIEHCDQPLIDARHVPLGVSYSLGHLCINLASATVGLPAVVELQTDRPDVRKVVLVGGYDPRHVDSFKAFSVDQGLTDVYAVPKRGVAGGYYI